MFLTFQRRKERIKQTTCTQPQIVAFGAPTYRAFQKTTDDLLINELVLVLALLQGLRLQLASYRFP